MPKDAYINYIRNLWPLPFVFPWAWGPTNIGMKPWRWKSIYISHYKGQCGWHYDYKEIRRLGYAMTKYLLTKGALERYAADVQQSGSRNIALAKQILGKDISQLSLEELARCMEQWYAAFCGFASYTMVLDATDEVLETLIRNEVNNTIASSDVFTLVTPQKESFIQEEERVFRSFVLQYRRAPSEARKRTFMKRHLQQWWWKDLGWGQLHPMTHEALRRRVDNTPSTSVIRRQQLDAQKNRKQFIRKKKLLYAAIPSSAKRLLTLFEIIGPMHDFRKKVQMHMMYAGLLCSKEIIKRRRISSRYLLYFIPQEIIALAKGESVSQKELRDRSRAYWCTARFNHLEIKNGVRAIRYIERTHTYDALARKRALELSGSPASAGIVTGAARVESNPHHANKHIKQGEILVTSMTSPDFLPAIKKAAAIVTDEGGINCHAAIISRELGIPCIIGTKEATRLLKTGDRIEVNADRGFVRFTK